MDALDAILRTVRLETSVLSRAHFGAPWAVDSAGTADPIFHAVREGSCFVRRRRAKRWLELREGDVVVLPGGQAHVMASDPDAPTVSLDGRGPTWARAPMLEHTGGGARCRILCGNFRLDHAGAGWLLELLPPVLHMRASDPEAAVFVRSTLDLIDRELESEHAGADTIVARLTDLLVVRALREAAAQSTDVHGWLGAARDPQVGKALALIHREPEQGWTAATLATKVGMSRTRFFDRFTEVVGEPPARYVTRWRATVAAELLSSEKLGTAEVAARVGYASDRAFHAMFRKHHGMSPSAYRRSRETPS